MRVFLVLATIKKQKTNLILEAWIKQYSACLASAKPLVQYPQKQNLN
jgi:hypothetical protein